MKQGPFGIWPYILRHIERRAIVCVQLQSCPSFHATCNPPISEIPFVTNLRDLQYRFPLPCGLGYMTPRALQPEYALLMYDSMTPVPRLEDPKIIDDPHTAIPSVKFAILPDYTLFLQGEWRLHVCL